MNMQCLKCCIKSKCLKFWNILIESNDGIISLMEYFEFYRNDNNIIEYDGKIKLIRFFN